MGLPFQTEVSVDGVSVQGSTNNSPIADAFPSTESISELRADGAMNNAEFGQPGEITVISKGGPIAWIGILVPPECGLLRHPLYFPHDHQDRSS